MDAMVELTCAAMEVDTAAPWEHPRAAELDAITVETWIVSQPYCEGAKVWLRALTRALFPAEPGEISLLHALFFISSRRRPGEDDRHHQQRPGDADHPRVDAGVASVWPDCWATGSGSTARCTASTTTPTVSPCITSTGRCAPAG